MRNLKLVKFKDNNFGIRRKSNFLMFLFTFQYYEYLDLYIFKHSENVFWLGKESGHFIKNCRSDLGTVQSLYLKLGHIYELRKDQGHIVVIAR